MPSGRDKAFHDALWAHVEHLHLRGLADTHITKRRQTVERLEAFPRMRRTCATSG